MQQGTLFQLILLHTLYSQRGFVLPSGSGSYYGEYFGAAASDILVPGAYDGDGKTDCTVWRGNNGYWYILLSSNHEGDWYQWGSGTLNDISLTTNPGSYLYQIGVLYP